MPAPLLYHGQGPRQGGGARGVLQRPYSYTGHSAVIPEVQFSEALGAQLGTYASILLIQ